MCKLGALLQEVGNSLVHGRLTESGIYTTAYFKVNGKEYFIDAQEWGLYRIRNGDLYRVKDTVSEDKNYYLITAINRTPIKLHRLLAAALLEDGVDKILSGRFNVNHMIIPCAKCDKEQAHTVNSPQFLELVTSEQNSEHRNFVRANLLYEVPISYYDIEFFDKMFTECKIPLRQRAFYVYSAYVGRRYGNERFSALRNILETEV